MIHWFLSVMYILEIAVLYLLILMYFINLLPVNFEDTLHVTFMIIYVETVTVEEDIYVKNELDDQPNEPIICEVVSIRSPSCESNNYV